MKKKMTGASLLAPGGEAARSMGCTCKIVFTAHKPNVIFVLSCPLHGIDAARETDHDRRVQVNLSFMV